MNENIICKCNICQNEIEYTTGKDEYPSCATLYYCKKGHWENYSYEINPNEDYSYWNDCKDFKEKYKCSHCKDTGKIKFKPLDDFTHYQWVSWEERDCEYCETKDNV